MQMPVAQETMTIELQQESKLAVFFKGNRLWWLALPTFIFFMIFFIIPVVSLFVISFNPSMKGVVRWQDSFTLANYLRFFSKKLYYMTAVRSVLLAAEVAFIAIIIGYPLAFLIAKTEHPGRNTFLMILVLVAMQLDMVIRLYGMMVLLGDNGLINQMLTFFGLTEKPVRLMYNRFGVVAGLVQFTLPFMVLSMIGSIRGINPSLEEAARSLGASRWRSFWRITLPLSMPGILAGSLLVFALSISSYVVPTLMGGWKVMVMPIHIYQQIAEVGRWQFGSSIGVILFGTSLLAVFVYQRYAIKTAGGQA
jgi:putative spermidine/putrescine transport system permease protein